MDDRRLPFAEHLRDLRACLRNAVLALIAAMCVTFWFSERLYELLLEPLRAAAAELDIETALHYGALTEPFWVYFEVALYAGVFLASPVIFHQLWRFIAPGLYQREKSITLGFAVASALCFVGGALFCYFLVFPAAFRFFLSYASATLEPTLFMRPQLDLAMNLLLAFGVVFELPLLIFFLSYAGLVTHRSLWRFNKYAVVLSFIVGGILTPGPDIASQLMMSVPMIALYNLSILVSFLVTKRREGAQEEASKEPGQE